MIRLKEDVIPEELEIYGFEADHHRGERLAYRYHLFQENNGQHNFEEVVVYIDQWNDAWGNVIYSAREVGIITHAFKADKAMNLIAKLINVGIFEYVEDEVFATIDEHKMARENGLKETFKKCIELSRGLAMSNKDWKLRGGVYRGNNTRARQDKYYNAYECEDRGMAATDEEFENCKDYIDLIGGWSYENRLLIRPLIEELGYYPYFPAFYRAVRKRRRI